MAANNGDELSPNGPGSSHGIPACFLQDYPEEFREQVAIDMRQALEDEAVAEGLAPIGGSRDEPGYRRFLEASKSPPPPPRLPLVCMQELTRPSPSVQSRRGPSAQPTTWFWRGRWPPSAPPGCWPRQARQ